MSTSSVLAVGEAHRLDLAIAEDFLRDFVEVHLDAQGFDLLHQHPRAGVVDLPRHETRGEFDHVRFQAQIVRRLGRFQPQQPAADDGGALRPLAVVA